MERNVSSSECPGRSIAARHNAGITMIHSPIVISFGEPPDTDPEGDWHEPELARRQSRGNAADGHPVHPAGGPGEGHDGRPRPGGRKGRHRLDRPRRTAFHRGLAELPRGLPAYVRRTRGGFPGHQHLSRQHRVRHALTGPPERPRPPRAGAFLHIGTRHMETRHVTAAWTGVTDPRVTSSPRPGGPPTA